MTPREFIAAFDVIAEAPGGVERLRELVLQLAVRGRLVPQEPGDEPAGRLLEHIAQEKTRLEQAKEIGKQKPVPSLDSSATAVELPTGWAWTCTAALGILNPRNEAEDDAMVSFCPMPVIPTDYRQRAVPETRCWGDIKKGYTHFANGDVVVAKITPCFQNRKSCVMTGLEGGIGAGTTELHVIRIVANKVIPEYLLLFYKSPDFLQGGVEMMTGTAGQQRVPREYFAYTPLPLPPLAEQHRIVAKVDELMGLIDRLEAAQSSREVARAAGRDSALATLRNAATPKEVSAAWTRIAGRMDDLFTAPADLVPLREAVLQLAVRGRLVPQDSGDEPAGRLLELTVAEKVELVKKKKVRKRKSYGSLISAEIPFEIPRSWTWARLHDLVHDLGQKVPDKTFSYIDVSTIDNKRGAIISAVPILDPSEAPSRARKLVRLGSVIYSTVRPYLLNIAIVDCEYSPIPIASTAFAVLHPHSGVHSCLLFYWLRAPFFSAFVTVQMKGVAYPAINDTDLLRAPVPLPPTAEQYRIVAKVDELMGLIDRLEHHLVDKRKHHEASAAAAVHHL